MNFHPSISFYTICLTLLLCFNACVQKEVDASKKENPLKTEADALSSPPSKAENPLQPYPDFLQNLQIQRQKHFETANKDSLKHLFFQFIHKDVPAYWTGTKWNFNGITRTPKEGKIACGYFITNTLTDFGLDIPRFKLAQVPSSEMIEALCVNIQKPVNFEGLVNYIERQENETVFIVGLDFHTGYITKASNDEIYFIHSNYIGREGVVKERIRESAALKASGFYMIGNFSADRDLFRY